MIIGCDPPNRSQAWAGDSDTANVYTYDPLTGQVASESQVAGTSTDSHYYGPADNQAGQEPGAIKDLAVDQNGATLSSRDYVYDDAGRVYSMTIDGKVTFTYGYLGGTDLLNSTTVSYGGVSGNTLANITGYNAKDQLSSITTTAGSTSVYSAGYDYYSNGQRQDESVGELESDNATVDSRALTYGYDGQQQLTSVTNTADSSSVFSASYDAIGNRSGDSTLGAANSINEYANLSYNGRGDLTDDGTQVFTWDAKDRLTSVSPETPGGQQELYHYDSQNRLIQEDLASYDGINDVWNTPVAYEKFVYDGTHLVQVIRASTNKPLYGYAWGPDGHVDEFTQYGPSGTPFAYYIVQTDAGGNAQQLINASTGQVTASIKLDAWGTPLSYTGNAALMNAFGILEGNMWRDPLTGKYYAINRWDDPVTGRWMSPDPTEEAGGDNFYEDRGNDPINEIDPEGTSPVGDALSTVWSGMKGAAHGLYVAGEAAKDGVSWLAGTAVDTVNASVIVATNGEHRLYQQGPDLSYFNDLGQYSSRPEAQARVAEVKQNTLQNVLTMGIAGQGKAAINRYYGLIGDDEFTREVGGTAITQMSPVLSKGTGQGLFRDNVVPRSGGSAGGLIQKTTPPSVDTSLRWDLGDFDFNTGERNWKAPTGWRLPVNDGEWSGTPGNSLWKSNLPEVNQLTGNRPIPFKDGYIDLSSYNVAEYRFNNLNGTNADFDLADAQLAIDRQFNSPNAARVWRSRNGLTWHHTEDGKTLQLVPTVLNDIPHVGGASILRK